MFEGKTVLIVVPARGGSKGVKLKNIHPLGGRPLLAYTGDLVKKLDFVDSAVVSTDHPEIAAAAEKCGLSVPFMRPEDISGDRIGDYDVLKHALIEMEKIDRCLYEVIVMLQPTCPLRKPEHVAATVSKLVREDWDSVWTVSPTDLKFHPLKALSVAENGAMELYDPRGSAIIARQQLQPVYHRNGASYAVRRRTLMDQHAVKGARSAAVIIEDPLANIDSMEDFDKAERLLKSL